MPKQSAIGVNKNTKALEALSASNGQAIGWSSGNLSNVDIKDPKVIVSSTKPTTREDGSTLQVMDEWRSTSTGIIYYWFNNDWYTDSQQILLLPTDASSRSGSANVLTVVFTNQVLLIEQFTVCGTRVTGTHSSSAYWTFGIASVNYSNTPTQVISPTDVNAPTTIPSGSNSGAINTQFGNTMILSPPIEINVNNRLRFDFSERLGAVAVQFVSSTIQGRWKAP